MEPAVVCPFVKQLIGRFENRAVVVDVRSAFEVGEAAAYVRERNRLLAVRLLWNDSFSSIPFHTSWKDIPLVVYAHRFGEFRPFHDMLPCIKTVHPRVFLSSDEPDSYTFLMCLASLGVSCGLSFGAEPVDWDKVNGLMHYAVYGKTRHAAVDPFTYGVSHYTPDAFTSLDEVYFNDPGGYVHIDEQENVALTAEDLHEGKFAGRGIDATRGEQLAARVRERAGRRQEHLLARDACSFCPAFRLCGGRFAPAEQSSGCRAFFSDFMDAADYYRSSAGKEGA